MVKIKVYVEGGVMPNDNIDTQTMDNSNQFREAFSVLFEALGISPTAIEIVPAAGKNNAFRRFVKDGGYLLTDLSSKH